jgi:dihydroorotase
MTSLETTYAALRTQLPELSAERTVDLLSRNARDLFGLEQASIAEGQPASLSLFDPEGETRLSADTTRSKSKNSPFFGKVLKGRVIGILKGDQFISN